MHYRGLLRVVRRDGGVRVYAAHEHPPRDDSPAAARAQLDQLVDVAVAQYAPLPAARLSRLVTMLRYGAPQWHTDLRAACQRATRRLAHARVDGIDWYWPADEEPAAFPSEPEESLRLLAPFDPIVWDRARFARLFDWSYRFEAYTPIEKRKLGYYALPLLWRDRVIGWANLTVRGTRLASDVGYVTGRPPRERVFVRALEQELWRMRVFLGLRDGEMPA